MYFQHLVKQVLVAFCLWHIDCINPLEYFRGHLKKTVIYIILLFLCAPAVAQQNRGVSLRRQLQREMTMARFLAQEHPDAEADSWLEQAEQLQKEASALLRKGRAPAARRKARQARDMTMRVIKKLSRVHLVELDQQVKVLISRAEVIVSGAQNKEASRLLKQSRVKLSEARIEGQKGQYRKSFELLRMARFQVERSIELVEEGADDIDSKIRREQVRFENLLARAERLLPACDDEQAQKLYRQVMQQEAAISEALDTNDKYVALDLYYSSTRLVLRAINLCQGVDVSLQELAEQEIARLDDLIDAARLQDGEDMPRRGKFLNQASSLRDKARFALLNENYEQALQHAQKAIDLLNVPQKLNEQNRPGNRLHQELARLENEINKFRNSPNIVDNRKRALVEAAETCSLDASDFLDMNDNGLALQAILTGHRMLLKAESSLSRSTAESARNQIESLIKDIDEARQKSINMSLLVQADRALSRAQNAATFDQFDIAIEYAKLGEDIFKLEKP
jgi:HEPN domain-containing protein